MKYLCVITPYVLLVASGLAQDPTRSPSTDYPIRTLTFKALDSPASLAVSPVISFPAECTSDGSLFLDMRDPKNLSRHTFVAIHGKNTTNYQLSAITDLHDITVLGFFPTDHTVGFLVRASRESPGPHVPGRSAAGIPWSDYHNFVALFDRTGQYKESIQLPVDYLLNHFAILSSGEYLISGYDKLNSTPRLLFLKQSGEILRSIEMPSVRSFAANNARSGSFDSDNAAGRLLGSILFTRYKDDILVWRMNSSDPILEIGPGGSLREVTITPPAMSVFVDMVPASDRWVAHFRSESERENSAYSQTAYSYYEVNPQSGSLSSKLMQEGDIPNSLTCESDGTYLSFKKSQDDKIIMLGAE